MDLQPKKNKGKRYSTLMAKPSINIFDDENELGFVQSIKQYMCWMQVD